MAALAASLSIWGAGYSGNPCPSLITLVRADISATSRAASRMFDSRMSMARSDIFELDLPDSLRYLARASSRSRRLLAEGMTTPPPPAGGEHGLNETARALMDA